MDRVKMLVLLALRTMVSHRVKNAIVGSIMVFGTMLVVVGTSLLDSVEASMRESVTSSVTGHAQVFSAQAKDALSMFGPMSMSQDVGEIENSGDVARRLSQMENVEAVVPMALGNAVSFGKGELDRVLFELRELVRAGDLDGAARKKDHVQAIARLMLQENKNSAEISTDPEKIEEERQIILKVLMPEFWVGFERNPTEILDFLDMKLAPISTEGRLIYVRYLATDPGQFTGAFDRFRMVDGEMIPQGKRGLLFSKRFFERQVKNKVARELDAIKTEIERGSTISEDEVLKNRVDRMARLSASVVYQLDAVEMPQVVSGLERELGKTGPVETLMEDFLRVEDSNFARRYAYFYASVAPFIDLYDIKVGDEIVLQSFTKSGYAKSVKVKVWGTFNFEGLESSDLAGNTHLMDLVTFRALYGKMTAEQRDELSAIKAEAGVKAVLAEDAEAALFGEEAEIEGDRREAGELQDLVVETSEEAGDTYDVAELKDGLVLHMAVILRDPTRAGEFLEALKGMSELGVQGIDWQAASGLVGQFILVIRLVLYTAIFVIFLVALVIINNSMVMATMERIPEIGTMRAIGAQKSTIMLMTLLETTALCLGAGTLGAGLGAGVIAWLGVVGIPASNDVMVFLFGGPALHPTFDLGNLIFGGAIILFVSLVSTMYPAMVATRVQPVVAMRGKD